MRLQAVCVEHPIVSVDHVTEKEKYVDDTY